ncbi:MAG: Mur ligase family protein [bacterium]|nr:Mur ligase family protein [bacterium]
MNSVFYIISFLWLVRTLKAVLFWIYLWQLKEYHIGRFVDHFRTNKGKKIFFNGLFVTKVILFLLMGAAYRLFPVLFLILFFLYMAEFLIAMHGAMQKSIKKPVFTFKTALLTVISLALVAGYLFSGFNIQDVFLFTAYILALDILLPLIVSGVVLLFQPFFVVVRNITLQKARNKMAQLKHIKVIGITGSYGKTSTKEFLTAILAHKYNVISTKDHQNSEMGIAKCILGDVSLKHEIFVVEMGAYKKGGIDLLCSLAKPQIGIVTGVNQQHLSLFGSMENLLSAEGGDELAQNLPLDGLLILNGDNRWCADLYKRTTLRKRIYTVKKDVMNADIWTEEIEMSQNSISFIALSRDKQMAHFTLNMLGSHNVQNVLAAVLAAKELGMTLEEIAAAAKSIKQQQSGIAVKPGINGINIIDSSYSSNPDGVMADLDYLKIFPGKRIIVMPCLIELGNTSSETHYHIGKKIAQVCDLAIITTQDKFEDIRRGAIEGGMKESNIIFSEHPRDIFTLLKTFQNESDAVLLEGRVPGELITLLHAQ